MTKWVLSMSTRPEGLDGPCSGYLPEHAGHLPDRTSQRAAGTDPNHPAAEIADRPVQLAFPDDHREFAADRFDLGPAIPPPRQHRTA